MGLLSLIIKPVDVDVSNEINSLVSDLRKTLRRENEVEDFISSINSTNLTDAEIEQRESELKIRRKMLKIHQIIGYATLAGMLAQGFIGSQLYNGNYKLYETHKLVGNLTSISYFTGAGLSLFSPPPLVNKKTKGLNSIKAHKYLASIHFSAMVTTNFLANKNKKIHRIAAYTAVGSFATAIIVFKF